MIANPAVPVDGSRRGIKVLLGLFLFGALGEYLILAPLVHIAQVAGTLLLVLWFVRPLTATRPTLRVDYSSVAILLLSLVFFSGYVLNVFYHGDIVFGIAYPLAGAGAALWFAELAEELTPALTFMVYLVTAYFLLRLLSGADMERLLVKGSNNQISALVLGMGLIWYMAQLARGETPGLKMAFVIWIGCVAGLGRGGIISATAMLFGMALTQPRRNALPMGLFVFGALLLLATPQVQALIYMQVAADFQGGTASPEREFVWTTYVEHQDLATFFFGLNPRLFQQQVGLTLHNSYLALHASYGIAAIIVVLASVILLPLTLRKPLVTVILFTILFRGMTDVVLLADGLMLGTPFFMVWIVAMRNLDLQTSMRSLQAVQTASDP